MSDPSPKECLFKRGGVSSLEHWSGSIFTKSVGKDLTELTSPEIREKAQQSILAASLFLSELERVQKPKPENS